MDAVHITRLRADHCIDLLAYSYARRYHPAGLPPVLPVRGPVGLRERIAVSDDTPPTDELLDVYDVRELGAGTPRGDARRGPKHLGGPARTGPLRGVVRRLRYAVGDG